MISAPKGLRLESVFASCPATVRAQPSHISTDSAGKLFAYPSGNTVVVRNVEDPKHVLICTRHATQVTAARLSPSGFLCASGDKDGNVIIWANKEGCVVQLQQKALGGPVRDIAWTEDQERIVAVGEGRESKAAVFAANGGNQIGSIIGHGKTIQTCDMRKQRPFRIVTGSQDSVVAFHEGPPFKFSKSHSDSALITGNVNAARFSPDGSHIAVVSGSKEVLILDGKTGDKEKMIATNHTGSIYSLAWSPDGQTIATASADKTVKLYSLSNDAVLATHSFGTRVEAMQQGVAHSTQGWLAIGLGGDINMLDAATAAVRATWRGHSRPITGLVHSPSTNRLLSFGADGKILAWGNDAVAAEVAKEGKEDVITAVAVLASGSVAAAAGEDVLVTDPAGCEAKYELKGAAGNPVAIAAVSVAGSYALVYKSAVKVVCGGSVVAEVKLSGFDAACADSFADLIAVGGDKAVKLLQFSSSTNSLVEVRQFSGTHAAQVTAVKFNSAGTAVASGDSNRCIYVWDAATCALLFDELVFHSSRIVALAWSRGDQWLASGSVDSSIILWDLPNKKRIMQNSAHQGGITAVVFDNSGDTLYSAGGDNCIKKWAW